MPCYDGREKEDAYKATKAACEMAKLLRANMIMFALLSGDTQRWIIDHERWDKEFGEIAARR